jgi:hypothetical protein
MKRQLIRPNPKSMVAVQVDYRFFACIDDNYLNYDKSKEKFVLTKIPVPMTTGSDMVRAGGYTFDTCFDYDMCTIKSQNRERWVGMSCEDGKCEYKLVDYPFGWNLTWPELNRKTSSNNGFKHKYMHKPVLLSASWLIPTTNDTNQFLLPVPPVTRDIFNKLDDRRIVATLAIEPGDNPHNTPWVSIESTDEENETPFGYHIVDVYESNTEFSFSAAVGSVLDCLLNKQCNQFQEMMQG